MQIKVRMGIDENGAFATLECDEEYEYVLWNDEIAAVVLARLSADLKDRGGGEKSD
ncbi:MAG: hypothetical protein LUG52_10645 [Clostridia bacterium]|nr:hypothetical protein [Clostridia bacterium]